MAKGTKPFTALEKNILKAKGLTAAQVGKLAKAGVKGRGDFRTVGDAATLASLVPGLSVETAAAVMAWANGAGGGSGGPSTGSGQGGPVVVESAEVVYCVHCKTKQPKDWKSGDLCVNCGKEAEPVQVCFWCNQTGPGKVCRRCGTPFVPAEDVELAAQLKREGVAKDEIGPKLARMGKPDRDALRARAQKYR
ncbi:MAG: hypothetical protein L0216_07135 [Planctomycetales bacterium]|nr:hypothetical protein [Planctomycetales bacterium]